MIEKIKLLLNRWNVDLNLATNINQKSKIQKKINEIQKIFQINEDIIEYEKNIQEIKDEETKEYFKEEIKFLENKAQNIYANLLNNLLPQQVEKIILEIRSAEGGQEAELFALELLEMYKKLCKKKFWTFVPLNINYKESAGIKDAIVELSGKDIDFWLKQESGVHCVKRVPQTEKKGRTHTSTSTVAILKQPKTIEIEINEKDLKIEVFRSSGPGGQSVNTTDSAVRITHIPTGIVASQQDEKSQIKNKEKAMKILNARIYAQKLEEENQKNCNERRSAIGTAKRNERIRTYHFTQNWVNDSRIEIKSHNIDKFMAADDLIIFLEELLFNII